MLPTTETQQIDVHPVRTRELISAIAIAACFVVLPMLYGELYPFTNAPMFSDSPQRYCQYRIHGPNGESLRLEDFELQRNYDGNPVGSGTGIKPPPTLDRFGQVVPEDALRNHVKHILNSRFPDLAFVDVLQQVIGPTAEGGVGIVQSNRIRVMSNVQ